MHMHVCVCMCALSPVIGNLESEISHSILRLVFGKTCCECSQPV